MVWRMLIEYDICLFCCVGKDNNVGCYGQRVYTDCGVLVGGGTRPRWGETPRADVSTLRLAALGDMRLALGGEGEFWIV